jgi:raffinose/stachyose/melibiose transport system permease protein
MGYGVSVFLLFIGGIYLYPFLWMAGSALKTEREFFARGAAILPGGAWQWQNYALAWDKARFGQYFVNSVVTTAGTVVTTVLLTSIAAYALARLRMPGKPMVLGLLIITFLLPHSYSILPALQVIKALGLLNTRAAIILLDTVDELLVSTVLFYGYMRTIPQAIEEAAIIDGAGVGQRYWSIILPMSQPMIGTVALVAALGAWNEFFTALVLTLGSPDLRTLPVGMYAFVGQTQTDWTLLYAAGMMSIGPVIVLFIALQRQYLDAFARAIKR